MSSWRCPKNRLVNQPNYCWWLAGAMATALVATPASGAPRASLHISGDDRACPAPAQVASVLAPLLRGTKISSAPGSSGPEDASVSDQGSKFRVEIAGRERVFSDSERDCTERARQAAVFIALVLDPPLVADRSLVETPPEKPAPIVTPSRPRSGPNLDLELGSFFQSSPAAAERSAALAGGVVARARWRQSFYLSAGAGVSPGSLHFADVDARAWWFPIDVAAGFAYRSSSFEIAADLGPALTILSITAENLDRAESNVRLDVGGRASLGGRLWLSEKIALFVSAQTMVFPHPYRLVIEGQGDVGATPGLWWGGTLGFVTRLD